MNTSRIKKILVLLLIIGLIFIQVLNPKVHAEGLDINNLFGNEITDEEGNGSDLNNVENNVVANNTVNNNTSLNSILSNNTVANNTTTNNTTTNNTTNNTTLPKTGTSENILISLMVICAISGVYAYKKVKEYNM